jgi:hypothetical protein
MNDNREAKWETGFVANPVSFISLIERRCRWMYRYIGLEKK